MVTSANPATRTTQKTQPQPTGNGSGGGIGNVIGGAVTGLAPGVFGTIKSDVGSLFSGGLGAVHDWLSSLGGMIGSGIEAGMVSFFKDTFDIIVGPVEIILGAIIAAFVLIVYFKDDVAAGIGFIGKMSMMAGA